MTPRAEFCLLGPLLVRWNGVQVAVPRGRQRAVLAALLLNAGRVVSVDELAEVLWGAHPPPSERVTVQNTVMRLRQSLGAARSLIGTQPRGYLITIAAGELDVSRFEDSIRVAQSAIRDTSWPQAATAAAAALALWRGEPLADAGSELLTAREAPRLAELRLQALEARIDADLHLGRHKEVIGELRLLVSAHPLRENLHGLLMVALYRDGRQGEALAAYVAARRVLVEELGAEPGLRLSQLHQQILTADRALALPPTAVASDDGGARPAPPRELPAGVGKFTGRAAELAALTRLLDQPTSMVVISAIGGTAGVGKTALAVHWAHQVAGQFPDGQLYVNLRGYDPSQPMTAADALAGFLSALGVSGTGIPAGEAARSARYRSLLAGKRMLILLDNARSVGQVRPLLPGMPGCAVLVTSRDSLAGLVARDGATRLDLDLLPLADAVALLRALIGQRASADPGAAAELALLCCRLPLALRVTAELAAARPDATLAELAGELADQQGRLDLLDAGGDPFAAVRTVFSWSYRNLDAGAARTFRLAGLHPGAGFDAYATAALTGATLQETRRALDALARAHLIQPVGPGRYTMHDLLRAYAVEQAAGRDADSLCHLALTGLFDYYRSVAAVAMDLLYPAEAHRRPRIAPTSAAVPELPDEAGARAWLDAERANLVAVVVHCADHAWPDNATDLANTLFRYLMTGSHGTEAEAIYRHVLQAALRSGDRSAEADALNGLGGIGIMRGQFRDAAGHYQAALQAYRQCGDRTGQAWVLRNLGITEYQLHNLRSAASYHREAIAAFEDAGDSLGAARGLAQLAAAETELGSYDQAAEHLQRALAVHRDAKDQSGEADALTRLGELNLRRGQLTEAAASFEHALAIRRHIGYSAGVAAGLSNLGEVSLRRGDYQRAISHLREALALCRYTGDQYVAIVTLRTLAEALHAAGQPADARAELAVALRLAAETGNTYQQASAHRDLADSYHHAAEDERACYHWQQALTLYTQLSAPEAEHVRALLIETSRDGERQPEVQ
jgi:DNA-binding SARP family transcriptional activator/predicted negative regulator of RcsB-dependent stress response